MGGGLCSEMVTIPGLYTIPMQSNHPMWIMPRYFPDLEYVIRLTISNIFILICVMAMLSEDGRSLCIYSGMWKKTCAVLVPQFSKERCGCLSGITYKRFKEYVDAFRWTRYL